MPPTALNPNAPPQIDPSVIQQLLTKGGGWQSLFQGDPSQPSPPMAPTGSPGTPSPTTSAPPAGALSSAMAGGSPSPSSPTPSAPSAASASADPLQDYIAQHGHAPIESAPPAPPQHGTAYKIFDTIGRLFGNPIAEQAYDRDWNLKQQNIAYQRNAPVMQEQADRAAYQASLGEGKTAADTRLANTQADIAGQNLPAQEKAGQVHDELMQRWQSNVDPDENSFLQYAQQRLAAEPFAVQRRLNGDPTHGIPSPLQGITQLPRQPFNFKTESGAIVPATYRGQNYGPEPSPNEPPEVTAARKTAMDSIAQAAAQDPAKAQMKDWLAKNPGKGPADYEIAMKKIVPAYNFHLQNGPMQAGGANEPTPTARGLADGSLKWQDVVSSRTPMVVRDDLLRQVKAINPDFNAGTFEVEQNVKKEFTSGDAAKNLTAFNTAIEHANQLRSATDALDNGDSRTLNKIGNALGYQFGSDKTTNFNTIKSALTGEISKVFKGGNATDAEIKEMQGPFDSANSTAQLKGAIDQAVNLMNSKREALQQQYQSGVQGKPNFGNSQEGPTATGPNGHKIKVVGGKWVDAATGQPIQ